MNLIDLTEKISTLTHKIIGYLVEKTPPLIAEVIPEHINRISEEAYSRGHNKGKTVGYSIGESVGYEKGLDAGEIIGHKKGNEEGYKTGVDDGKNVWVIQDDRKIKAPQPVDISIYGPGTFDITNSMCQEMRSKVAEAVSKKLIEPPTDDQWKMIFSNSPSTCIPAGAGSGKSTTLILRLIFMLEHRKIPQSEITVISFTKAACKELRHSLIEVLSLWRIREMTYEESCILIRTFHSALYKTAKSVFGKITFFENIKEENNQKRKNVKTDVSEINGEKNETIDEDMDNPFATTKLNNLQLKLIKDAYIELFNTNPYFKNHILAMLKLEYSRALSIDRPESEYIEFTTRIASQRDEILVQKVNDALRKKGYLPGENFVEGPIKIFTALGYPFYANGIIGSTKTPVFFGGFAYENSLFESKEQIADIDGKNQFGIYEALKVKKNIVTRYLGGAHIYINSPEASERIGLLFKALETNFEMADEAPIFDIRLDGEIGPSSIFEAFYSQASFIENMGIGISDVVGKMRPFRKQDLEYHFSCALPLYWNYFENKLKTENIITFNHAFLTLAKDGGNRAKMLDRKILAPFTHLLIDEFQDISAQIVNWLLQCQRQILYEEKENTFVSIMAIGDDWQSIYGWRGSAPDFFIKFDTHFPSHYSIRGAAQFPMGKNFRSIEAIVRQSEMLLSPIKSKTRKTCEPVRKTENGDHGIQIIECGEYNEKTYDMIVKCINDQYAFATSIKNGHKNKVIVMSRTNNVLEKIETRVAARSGIIFQTYHRAKGLQAEVAIMVEDCVYDQIHKFRNRIYECSEIFSEGHTYDQAQKDEAARLAYVGTTRGRRRVIWYVDQIKGASKELRELHKNVNAIM